MSIERYLDEVCDMPLVYLETLNEFVDADMANSLLKSICNSEEKTDRDLLAFAKDLRTELNNKLLHRAELLKKKYFCPMSALDKYFDEDVAQLNRLGIRS